MLLASSVQFVQELTVLLSGLLFLDLPHLLLFHPFQHFHLLLLLTALLVKFSLPYQFLHVAVNVAVHSFQILQVGIMSGFLLISEVSHQIFRFFLGLSVV